MNTRTCIRWTTAFLLAFVFCESNISFAQLIRVSDELRAELGEKALEYVSRFGIYVNIVSNKSSYPEEITEATRLALQLFDREDATVEVSSSRRSTTQKFTIAEYLNRLMVLPYSEVSIEWAEIAFVSDIHKGTDGNYYGIATIDQRFTGFLDGAPVYRDITTKYIEIVIKQSVVDAWGEKYAEWEVFLSDISVIQTWEG